MLENYDPNEARSFDTVHVVELTFMSWDRKAVLKARVGGNCQGVEHCIDVAIDQIIDGLPTVLKNEDGSEYRCPPTLVLTDETGENSLLIDENSDVEKPFEDVLREVLVGIRIVGLEPRAALSAAAG